MRLNRISILNFKNIAEATLQFSPKTNCLVGHNGMGKSNLLEAVYYLATARSFLNLPDRMLLRHDAEAMMVQGAFERDNASSLSVSIGMQAEHRKVLRRDGKECRRLSEHIGSIPLVVVSPADGAIVSGSAEERRRLMDMVISQADAGYLKSLIAYNRALAQRNSLLRQGLTDPLLCESVETQMEQSAMYIHSARRQWVEETATDFREFYTSLSGGREEASMTYQSVLDSSTLNEIFHRNRAKDAAIGHTSQGPHRDDIEMLLDKYPARKLASQGQLKTFTLALRMAIYRFLLRRTGETPILLLDDIFDRLDSSRVENILTTVADSTRFGQIFITDTNRSHIDSMLRLTGDDYRLLSVDNGHFQNL